MGGGGGQKKNDDENANEGIVFFWFGGREWDLRHLLSDPIVPNYSGLCFFDSSCLFAGSSYAFAFMVVF